MLKTQCASSESVLHVLQSLNCVLPARLSLACHVCRYVQWCHGAPSLIPVLAKAYELLDDSTPQTAAPKEQILAAAKKAADVVWERGLLTKVGLLHHHAL